MLQNGLQIVTNVLFLVTNDNKKPPQGEPGGGKSKLLTPYKKKRFTTKYKIISIVNILE